MISDTDNTGHITGKQHSISRIGGIIADGGWPNLTLQNTANYGNLQYAVNDDYAEAEIGGILGQGCEAEESDKSTWNALQKHVIANSINYGEIQIGSEQNYRAVTVGGLAGKAEADRWQYCYEARMGMDRRKKCLPYQRRKEMETKRYLRSVRIHHPMHIPFRF